MGEKTNKASTKDSQKELFPVDETSYGADYKSHYLEQYKMFVETTNHVNQLRSKMNDFYIACNTLWIGITTGFCRTNQFVFASFSFLGIMIAVSWFIQLKVYRSNNREKYIIIHDIEKLLPIAPYEKWNESVRRQRLWHSTSIFESIMPIIFASANIILLIVACFFFPFIAGGTP